MLPIRERRKIRTAPLPPVNLHGLMTLNTSKAVEFLYTQPRRFRK